MNTSSRSARPASQLTRRGLLTAGLGVTAAAALTACGSSSATGAGASGSASEKHTLTDTLGRKVELSTRPQRIISLMDWASGMAVLSLGGSLAGMMTRNGNSFMKSISAQYDLSKVKPLGSFDQWNIEQIAALKPDLIFASAWEGKANVDQLTPEKLQAVAPTYFLEDGKITQDDFMKRVGEAIGKQDEVEKQRAEYQAKLASVKADLQEKAKG